jgi:hypothetical protein
MNQSVMPKWISFVCGFMCLLGLFVGSSLYISPKTFIVDVDFSTSGVRFLAYMWAARQIAIAAIIGFSVLRKSVPMLQVSLVAYCLMVFQDVIIGIVRHDLGLILGSTFAGVLAVFISFRLSRQARGTP